MADRIDYQFTVASLARGGADLAAVEQWWEAWIDRLDNGDTYDDVLDRLDGSDWGRTPDGTPRVVDLGDQTDTPVYRRLVAIGRRVRRETRD